MQTYEYAYHRNFRTVHQRIATLHVRTYALLLSDRFLRALTATPPPTLSQDGRTLTLDDAQFQIFNKPRGNLQDIWRAVKALVAARKNGRAAASNVDAEWFHLGFCSSTNWPSESIFESNLNKIAVF